MARAEVCNLDSESINPNHTKIRLTTWDRKWSAIVRKRDNDPWRSVVLF
jgi:hypothetical protein